MKHIIELNGEECLTVIKNHTLGTMIESLYPDLDLETKAVIEPEPEKKKEPVPQTQKEETVTEEEVRAVLSEKLSGGKRDEVKALFKEFGVNKLPEVDAADYPALIEKARAL